MKLEVKLIYFSKILIARKTGALYMGMIWIHNINLKHFYMEDYVPVNCMCSVLCLKF
jgi:hypothetical protein